MCCCCWEKYVERSKSLKKMNKNLEEQIQMFIFPGYYPRDEWGAKVAKVYLMIFTFPFSLFLLDYFYF